MTATTIGFSKMHGLGNDFVVIDAINQAINLATLPVNTIADRHFGIGCDQILVIQNSTKADFLCRIYNTDGSQAEQCGNGLRAVARYVHEHQLITKLNFSIETLAGVFPVVIHDYQHISITMSASTIRANPLAISLPMLDATINGVSISMGNPHFITKVDNIGTAIIERMGYLIATHSAFPQGVNVGFVQHHSAEHITLRTHERGVGETLACGSNACAAVAAGVLDGSLGHRVTVSFKHGDLQLEWEGNSKPMIMTGPAELTFTGEWPLI